MISECPLPLYKMNDIAAICSKHISLIAMHKIEMHNRFRLKLKLSPNYVYLTHRYPIHIPLVCIIY